MAKDWPMLMLLTFVLLVRSILLSRPLLVVIAQFARRFFSAWAIATQWPAAIKFPRLTLSLPLRPSAPEADFPNTFPPTFKPLRTPRHLPTDRIWPAAKPSTQAPIPNVKFNSTLVPSLTWFLVVTNAFSQPVFFNWIVIFPKWWTEWGNFKNKELLGRCYKTLISNKLFIGGELKISFFYWFTLSYW